MRSSMAQRNSRVSTISRGFTLRRMPVSLSASSRSIRSTSPGWSTVPIALQRRAERLGQALRLGPDLEHQQRRAAPPPRPP